MMRCYIDGTFFNQYSGYSRQVLSHSFSIGWGLSPDGQIQPTNESDIQNNFVGKLAGLRIYDRVLEDSEIQALAEEFTPTPSA